MKVGCRGQFPVRASLIMLAIHVMEAVAEIDSTTKRNFCLLSESLQATFPRTKQALNEKLNVQESFPGRCSVRARLI